MKGQRTATLHLGERGRAKTVGAREKTHIASNVPATNPQTIENV